MSAFAVPPAGANPLMSAMLQKLPSAGGPSNGLAGDPATRTTKIAVLGDSVAAGCGARTHACALPGFLAQELAVQVGGSVRWNVLGRPGATMRTIRRVLLPDLEPHADIVVVAAGASDVIAASPVTEWAEELEGVLDELEARAARVVVCGVPSFVVAPALSFPLRRVLAEHAQAIDGASQKICVSRRSALWFGASAMKVADDFFAKDGLHPSVVGYRRWAQSIARLLAGSEAAVPPVGG